MHQGTWLYTGEMGRHSYSKKKIQKLLSHSIRPLTFSNLEGQVSSIIGNKLITNELYKE